jgi:hypothetical protein
MLVERQVMVQLVMARVPSQEIVVVAPRVVEAAAEGVELVAAAEGVELVAAAEGVELVAAAEGVGVVAAV